MCVFILNLFGYDIIWILILKIIIITTFSIYFFIIFLIVRAFQRSAEIY